MAKQEILPPLRSSTQLARRESAAVTVSPPRINTGGIIETTLTRWEAQRHTRTIHALTAKRQAEVALTEVQTQLVESHIKRQRALYRLQELPEVLANDRAVRQSERAETLRQAQHEYETAEMRRLGELAHAEAALVDAQQQLKAQRDYGYTTYELAWKKKNLEMLDVELSAAERRALLRQHIGEIDQSSGNRQADDCDVGEIDDALYERRAQLNASGLDTSRIDAVIARRKARTGD